MPYPKNKDLPDSIKNSLPAKAQSIWRHTFNSTHKKGASEESSIKQAWGAVKNAGYKKDNNTGKWELKKEASMKKNEGVFKAECSVTDVNESLGIVFGWGMVTDINNEPYYDLDNQHIPSDIMVKATSSFMETARISNDSHTPLDIGTVVHSFPLSTEIAKSMGITSNISGWMVGVKPDADTLAKFVSGEYKGFSIEGSGALVDDEEETT